VRGFPALASTDGQEDVGFAKAATQEKTYDRADPAKDRGGKSLPKANFRRIAIRSHLHSLGTLARHIGPVSPVTDMTGTDQEM
jgi:hypothetical protein